MVPDGHHRIETQWRLPGNLKLARETLPWKRDTAGMMVKPYCRAVVGTVVGVAAICGSAAAFVVGNAATGRIASGRARPMVSSVSDSVRYFPGQCTRVCTVWVAG